MRSSNKFNLIDYIYYRTFLYYNKKEGKNDGKIRGVFFVALLLSFNISTLVVLCEIFFNISKDFISYLIYSGFIFSQIIIFYIYVFKRHDKVINCYTTETEHQKENRLIINVIYASVSFILFVAVGYYR